jgi:PAS domain-containing protein
LEYRYQSVGKSTVWVAASSVALRDQHGAITGYLGTVLDMTERKQATDALARSEANFRALVERTPLGVSVCRGGVVLYANAALLALLGYDHSEQLIGRNMLELVHPDSQTLVVERGGTGRPSKHCPMPSSRRPRGLARELQRRHRD